MNTCGTCLHFAQWPEERQHKLGDYYHGKLMGDCNAPLPLSVLVDDDNLPMAANSRDCPCWVAKP